VPERVEGEAGESRPLEERVVAHGQDDRGIDPRARLAREYEIVVVSLAEPVPQTFFYLTPAAQCSLGSRVSRSRSMRSRRPSRS
jgi:hypothetical protein